MPSLLRQRVSDYYSGRHAMSSLRGGGRRTVRDMRNQRRSIQSFFYPRSFKQDSFNGFFSQSSILTCRRWLDINFIILILSQRHDSRRSFRRFVKCSSHPYNFAVAGCRLARLSIIFVIVLRYEVWRWRWRGLLRSCPNTSSSIQMRQKSTQRFVHHVLS